MYGLYKNPSGEINLDLTAVTKAMTVDDLKACPTAADGIKQEMPPLSELCTSSVCNCLSTSGEAVEQRLQLHISSL